MLLKSSDANAKKHKQLILLTLFYIYYFYFQNLLTDSVDKLVEKPVKYGKTKNCHF